MAYFPLLDVIRFAAAIGVVWIHVAGDERLAWTKELGRFAVPFFACGAVYLAYGSLRRHPQTSLGQYIAARFQRVYLVFLVWSAFYWAVRSFSSLYVEHTGPFKTTLVDFFWNGVVIQLWFLPFIFLATIAAFAVAKAVRVAPGLRLPFSGLFTALALLLSVMPVPGFVWHLGYAAGLSYEVLPSCCAALALALMERPSREDRGKPALHLPLLLIGGGLAVPWLLAAFFYGRSIALENVAGFGLLLASLSWMTRTKLPLIARLGASSFGIYLIHPLFVEGMQHLLPKFGLREHSPALEIAIFLSSLVASYVSVEILRCSKWARWLAG